MKQTWILAIVCLVTVSCSSLSGINTPTNMGEHSPDEQLKAEYHLMKNSASLATRENEVIKGENRICKAEIGQLKEDTKRLQAELAALNNKYEQDMAIMNKEYGALQTRYETLEEQGNARIQELTDLNTAAQDKLAEETVRFDKTLKAQLATFTADRQALESDFAREKQEYENRSNTMTKDLADKEAALASLNTALTQANGRIEGLQKTIAGDQVKLRSMQETIDEQQAAITSMQDNNDERQTAADNARAESEPAPNQ